MALTSLLRHLMVFTATLLLASASAAQTATYVVHMDSSVMPRAFSGHRSWYSSTLSAAATHHPPDVTSTATSNPIYVYDNAIHGFSARLSPAELEEVKKCHGFISAYPDALVKKDTTHTSQFLHLNAQSGLWPASNYGDDVIIGVVDSGVWPESESYRDEGMAEVPSRWKGECEEGTFFNSSACNRKLIGARYFNRGLLANHPNLTGTVNSPRDTDGHGTHTSSTAAGNYVKNASYFGYGRGTARGMAPKARLAVYKVLWDEGSYVSDLIAGIDRAISDGVDVLSISLGLNGFPLYEDPVAIATFAAMEKGIFVASSAGNEGPWLRLLHNGAPWMLTVGASTVDREFSGTVELGNGDTITGISLYPGHSALSSSLKNVPLVFMKTCNKKTLLDKVGYKIMVCRKNDALRAVINAVAGANVAGGVFISNTPYIEYDVHFTFPGVIVSPKIGNLVVDYIKRSPNPRASLWFRETILGTKPAPTVATYSSRGPSPSCPHVLKPDLVAPGSLVLASWSEVASVGARFVHSPFNIISGSSMACPHAAGVAALLKAAHPDWSPAAIRSAMMTTADELDNTMSPIKDMGDKYRPATPLAMGSGQINPNKALDPGLIYDAGKSDYVRLFCAMNFTKEQIHTITRSASSNCLDASLDLNYPSFIAFFEANRSHETVRVFRRTVTFVGDGAGVTYKVKVASMKGFKVSVVPQVLFFREKYEKQSFMLTLKCRVPMKDNHVVYGSLGWVDDQGRHEVRSPLVATSLGSQAL